MGPVRPSILRLPAWPGPLGVWRRTTALVPTPSQPNAWPVLRRCCHLLGPAGKADGRWRGRGPAGQERQPVPEVGACWQGDLGPGLHVSVPRFPLLCNEDNNLEVFLGPAQGRVGEALRASSRAVFRGAGGDPPGRCHDSSCCPRALPCVHGLADLQAAGLAALPWVACHVVVLGRAPRGLGTVVALLPVHTVGEPVLTWANDR